MSEDTMATTEYRYANGYGAIVCEGADAYEGREFTVTHDGEPVYDTPIERERGWWHISRVVMDRILCEIAALPARTDGNGDAVMSPEDAALRGAADALIQSMKGTRNV